MVHPESLPPPKPPAHSAAAALAAAAPLVHAALVLLGLLGACKELKDPEIRVSAIPVLAAIVYLAGFGLAGRVARQLVTALAWMLELMASAGETDARLAAAADRIAEALERAPTEPTTPVAAPSPNSPTPEQFAPADMRTMALAEIRVALRQGEWTQVETLFRSFTDNYPNDPASPALGEELKAAKETAVASLRSRLDAAREANDLERVLELREPLGPLVGPEALATLDRSLAKWFMALIQKRMRQGAMTRDIALLATRIAGAFDATPEGASLRAALPTLRRSVGLCARCGQPYTGIADACPSCLASSSFPVYVPPDTPATNGGPARSSGPAPPETIAPEPE